MRKILSYILVIAMLTTMLPLQVFASGEPTIKVADYPNATAGESIIVPVVMENNPAGISGLDMAFDVPEGWNIYLLFDMEPDYSIFYQKSVHPVTNKVTWKQVGQLVYEDSTSPHKFAYGHDSAVTPEDSNVICWLYYTIPATAVNGNHTIGMTSDVISDGELNGSGDMVNNRAKFTLISGTITVTGGVDMVTEVALTAQQLPAPVKFGTPKTSFTGTGYTGAVTWEPVVSDKFAASTAYTAKVTLTATGSYVFKNGIVPTVAGATVDAESITLSEGNKKLTFDATFSATAAKELASIEIETPATKLDYIEGQDFDAAGMKVNAIYDDNTTEENVAAVVTDGENLAAGKTSVTIEYNGKTTTQAITVSEKPSVADATVTVSELTYDGTNQTPTVTVKYGETTLTKGTDYEVSGTTSGTDAGTYELTINAKDGSEYKGTIEKTWTITEADMTANTLTDVVLYKGSTVDLVNELGATTKGTNPITYNFTTASNKVDLVADTGMISVKEDAVIAEGEEIDVTVVATADNHKDYTQTFTVKLSDVKYEFDAKNIDAGEYEFGAMWSDIWTAEGDSAAFTVNVNNDPTVGKLSLTSAVAGTYPTVQTDAKADIIWTANAGGYSTKVGELTVDITPKPLQIDVSRLTISDKEYDGTNNAEVDDSNLAFVGSTVPGYNVVNIDVTGTFESKDVGTHNVDLEWTTTDPNKANYTITFSSVPQATINPKQVEVTIAEIADQEYTGSPITIDEETMITFTGVVAGESLVKETDYTVTYNNNTNVGEATVTVSDVAGGNYEVKTATKNFEIVKKNGQIQITNKADLNVVYPNAVPAVKFTKNNTAGVVTVKYYTNADCTEGETEVKPTNAGTYWVKVMMAADTNYGAAEDKASFTIAKADITPVVSISGWTYGEEANTPSVTGNSGNGTVTYTYKVKDAADDTYTAAVPVNAGDYVVKATVAATQNYNGGEATAEFKIAKKNISGSLTIAAVADQPYNHGNPITPKPQVKLGETVLVEGTDFEYGYESNINAGSTAKITVVGKGNYTDEQSVPFHIVRAPLTLTVNISNWRVGNTPSTPSVEGNLGNGAVTYTYKVKDAADDTYTATVPTVIGKYTVKASVAQTENYWNADATKDFEITAKEIQDITAENVTVKYGDTNKSVVGTTNGDGVISYAVKSGAEVVEVNAATGALTIKKVGDAVITVSASETDTYAAATKDITVKVEQQEIAVPAADTTVYTYNGKAQTYKIAANDAYTVTGNAKTAANETGYTVTVALKDTVNTKWDDNSTEDKTYTFIIKKANLIITADSKEATVGDEKPALTCSIDGLQGTDALKTEPVLAYASEPDMKKTGTVGIIFATLAEAPDGDNYNITHVEGELIISAAPSLSDPTYSVKVDQPENGKIKLNKRNAEAGEKVTITVTPDEGYELVELIVTDRRGKEIKVTEQKNGKFTFKMPAGKVNIEAVFEKIDGDEEIENPFTDVAEKDYFYDAVLWAAENGITNGMSANTFAPGAVCNRAQVVTFLWRAAGCPAPKSNLSPFVDIAPDAYYYDAVLWAVENGITNGMSATEFAPNATVTRGQTVTFLWRAEHGFEMDGEHDFTDVASDAYYHDAVLWAVENGVTNGMSATTFAPMSGCTRGQIVTFLYRTFAE